MTSLLIFHLFCIFIFCAHIKRITLFDENTQILYTSTKKRRRNSALMLCSERFSQLSYQGIDNFIQRMLHANTSGGHVIFLYTAHNPMAESRGRESLEANWNRVHLIQRKVSLLKSKSLVPVSESAET